MDKYIPLKEAAELLGITRQAAHERVMKGELRAKETRQGPNMRRIVWLVRRSDVEAAIDRGDVGGDYSLRRRASAVSAKMRERRAAVDELRREGLSIRAIADNLGVTQPTIASDLRALGWPKGERPSKRDRRENDG